MEENVQKVKKFLPAKRKMLVCSKFMTLGRPQKAILNFFVFTPYNFLEIWQWLKSIGLLRASFPPFFVYQMLIVPDFLRVY